MKKMTDLRELLIENGKLTIDIESSIGVLRFRKLFNEDTLLLYKYRNNDPKEYCKHFIINQLKSPTLSLEELNLTLEEISIILKEYLTKIGIIDKFEFNNEFYEDFQKGMVDYKISEIEKNQEIMRQLSLPNSMQEFINQTLPATTPESVINETAKNIQEIIKPYQIMWESWAEKNKSIKEIHDQTQKYIKDAFKRFNISKKEAFNYLEKYHWIISPNMDNEIIYKVIEIFKSESEHKQKEINELFNNYFFDNDCEKLYELLTIWETKPRFNNRIKIIRNCIDTIKIMPENFNFSDVIVPTLIAQTEGVQMDIVEEYYYKLDDKYRIWISETEKLTDEHGTNIKFDEFYESLIINDEFLEAMNNLFIEILFQKTYPRQPYKKSIHFSRNKILHGENTQYGRKVYTSRCFLILDFLSELKPN